MRPFSHGSKIKSVVFQEPVTPSQPYFVGKLPPSTGIYWVYGIKKSIHANLGQAQRHPSACLCGASGALEEKSASWISSQIPVGIN